MAERYDQYIDGDGVICEIEPIDDGRYVKYEDYATLAASHRWLLEAVHRIRQYPVIESASDLRVGYNDADLEVAAALAEAEALIEK